MFEEVLGAFMARFKEVGGCRGAHLFALKGVGLNGPDFSPDGPDRWPGQPGHAARTARTPDGPDMWPGRPGRGTNHG